MIVAIVAPVVFLTVTGFCLKWGDMDLFDAVGTGGVVALLAAVGTAGLQSCINDIRGVGL